MWNLSITKLLQTAELIVAGATASEVAEALGVGEPTAKSYISKAQQQLGATDLADVKRALLAYYDVHPNHRPPVKMGAASAATSSPPGIPFMVPEEEAGFPSLLGTPTAEKPSPNAIREVLENALTQVIGPKPKRAKKT